MNTPSTPTTPTPDLESLRKAVQAFRPNPHRVPFNGLKPVHDSIVELRKQNVSYSAIAELLEQHGVKTSRARVAEYGRIVLEGGSRRKRRKYARTAPAAIQAVPPAPKLAQQVSTPNSLPRAANSERGPHIAKVELLPPSETCD